jgi:hypothetical protein
LQLVRTNEFRAVGLRDPIEAVNDGVIETNPEHCIRNVIEQALYEIRRRETLADDPIIYHAVAHVFEHAHRWLKPAVGGLVLRRAVLRMLLGEVLDQSAIREKEANSFVPSCAILRFPCGAMYIAFALGVTADPKFAGEASQPTTSRLKSSRLYGAGTNAALNAVSSAPGRALVS